MERTIGTVETPHGTARLEAKLVGLLIEVEERMEAVGQGGVFLRAELTVDAMGNRTAWIMAYLQGDHERQNPLDWEPLFVSMNGAHSSNDPQFIADRIIRLRRKASK